MKCLYLFILTLFRVMEKRALFWGKGALFGVVHTKNHGHYFEVALFGVALFEVLLYRNGWISASPCLIDPRGLRVTENAYF